MYIVVVVVVFFYFPSEASTVMNTTLKRADNRVHGACTTLDRSEESFPRHMSRARVAYMYMYVYAVCYTDQNDTSHVL